LKNLKRGAHMRELDVDEMIILKCMLIKSILKNWLAAAGLC
jgi:hypothetical protein